MKKIFTPRFIFIATVIFVAAFSRLLPHIPNVTPVAAIALFGGTFINRRYLAFILPLIALLISDLFIGFYSEMYAVYLSIALTVGIGFMLNKKLTVLNTVTASVASSVLFFILTNLAVWMSVKYAYPQTLAGLGLCYEAALPFFRSELLGTLAYNTVFFGVFYLAKIKFPILLKA